MSPAATSCLTPHASHAGPLVSPVATRSAQGKPFVLKLLCETLRKLIPGISRQLGAWIFACAAGSQDSPALGSKTPERIALRCVFDGLLKQMTAVAVRLNSECSEN